MTKLPDAEGVVTLHGRTIAYRTLAGHGTPVLLLHGVGLNMTSWGQIPQMLSRHGIPVIVMDLPGHGQSSGGRGDYSINGFAVVVRDLLDHLHIRRVDLVGHSLGGGVSMAVAFLFPMRVRRLVLEASGGLGEETIAALRLASLPGANLAIRLGVTDASIAAARSLGQALSRVGVRPVALDPGTLETVAQLTDAQRREAFVATLRSSVGLDGQFVTALEHLPGMDGERVLIIWGDSDPVIPVRHGRRAHEMLPGSTLVLFEHTGHEPHRADPERFALLVRRHVRPHA